MSAATPASASVPEPSDNTASDLILSFAPSPAAATSTSVPLFTSTPLHATPDPETDPAERARIQALYHCQILDTEPEQAFDDITRLASLVCGVPMALITLTDVDRQWFKSVVGLELKEIPRAEFFCAHLSHTSGVTEVPDSHADPRFIKNPCVTGYPHVRFYAGTPLISASGFALGFLCVLDTQPRTLRADQKEALLALGRQASAKLDLRLKLAEVKHREKELRWKTAFLEAQADSTVYGILVIDHDGHVILHNKRVLDLLQVPADIIADLIETSHTLASVPAALAASTSGYDSASRSSPTASPSPALSPSALIPWLMDNLQAPAAFQGIPHYLSDGSTQTIHDEVILGGEIHLDRYSAPVISKDGETFGRLWMYRDITPRKQAEVQLAEANEQLIKISRQAGMAEVASNVLHNVGNVLNSVNVSSYVLVDRIRKLRVGGLNKTAQLLAAQAHDLPQFLTQNNTAAKLQDYLLKLGQNLSLEQSFLLAEAQSLADHVQHIKELVAIQRDYTRAHVHYEYLQLSDLVEDALSICKGKLEKLQIKITRHYADLPTFPVEKHKVLQILINLISNAKQALQDGGNQDKELILQTGQTEAGRPSISIADNGVGIAGHFIDRIFSQGFTTKADGLGLGLHSAGNTAREMGGSLTAQSPGYGQGATFILELPSTVPTFSPTHKSEYESEFDLG